MVKKITKIDAVKQKPSMGYAQTKRVCAYCRVSTGAAKQKNSFEAQMQYYTRLIQEKPNWILAGIYTDEARSGTKVIHRDGFQQMIQDCKMGKIDLILTKSVTRFARNTLDSIQTIRMLKEMGIGVYFEKESIDTLSEKSEQLLTILSSIAQTESENISANSRWAIRHRFQSGTYTIGCPAYGYTNDENGELVIQPEQAAIVRRIFDEYLGGAGSYTIAKKLQADGVPTIKRAKAWQENVIREILQNPIYEGDVLYQKTYTTEGVPFTKKRNHGECPMYLIRDNHAPIITREEAEAVRQIFAYRKEKQRSDDTQAYQSRYVFSSRIVCGICGTKFRRQKIYIGKPYEKIQWSCYQHITDSTKCGQKAIREDVIQQKFVRMWNKLASHYEEILLPLLATLKAVPNDAQQEQELLELENRIQEIRKQNYMLQKILADGDIGSAVFIEKSNALDIELEEICQKQQLLRGKTVFEQEIAQTEYLLAIFRSRPTIIEEFDEELFQLVIENIIVYPDKRLGFRMKNGLELEEFYGEEVDKCRNIRQ